MNLIYSIAPNDHGMITLIYLTIIKSLSKYSDSEIKILTTKISTLVFSKPELLEIEEENIERTV